MDENPYEPPQILTERRSPEDQRAGRLRIDWQGIGRAIAVLAVGYAIVGIIGGILTLVGWFLRW